jgi:hypothetical protein
VRAGDPKQNPVFIAFNVEEKSGMPRKISRFGGIWITLARDPG